MDFNVEVEISTSKLLEPLQETVQELNTSCFASEGFYPFGEQTLLNLSAENPEVSHIRLTHLGVLIGYAQVILSNKSRIDFELAIHPKWRCLGLGTLLIEEITKLNPGKKQQAWAHGDLPATGIFTKKLGFKAKRILHFMERDVQVDSPTLPEDLSVRAFTAQDLELLWQLNHDAFSAHPEQGQLTIQDLQDRIDQDWFRGENLLFLYRKKTPVAFLWLKFPRGQVSGEIYVLGVSSSAQNQGLSKVLVNYALYQLRTQGAQKACLYVDESNTWALRSYIKAGFEITATHSQYLRKPNINPLFTKGCDDGEMTDVTSNQRSSHAENPIDPQLAAHIAEHIAEVKDATTVIDAPDPLPVQRFADREISWLAFNERVLELAEDPNVPLLERVMFLSIFASNLDEFFMVRVAGLKRRIATGIAVTAASGLSPRRVLAEIGERTKILMERHAKSFAQTVQPALAGEGITIVRWGDLSSTEQDRLTKYFRKQIFPVLTPLALDPAHPFPYISGLSLNLSVLLANPTTGKEHFARVKVPDLLPRFMAVDQKGKPSVPDAEIANRGPASFVALEEIIAEHLDHLFPGMEVLEKHTFRVTRNEDVEVEEDDAENLLKAMEKELLRRRFGPPIRLEIAEGTSARVRKILIRELGITPDEVYTLPEPLDLTGLNVIAGIERPELHYPKFVPTTHRQLAEVESATPNDIFAVLRERDVLLHHPYDSFSTSVQTFLEQAAADPNVLAIKQTLYRTSGDSPIVDALIDAAEAGKQVLALVEIKARFDEENNISWARKLEQAGVHVVYGIVGLKTHCKLSLVVRQEADGLRRYCHVGTGNYNPKTARLYTDLGLLTSSPDVGQDLTRLFNQLSGYAPKAKFHRLVVAPRSIRTGLISRIEREIENKKAGRDAWIKIKVNSIVDEALIDALYRASQAGVPIDLVVRGICAVIPGVVGLSETIKVRSILGRYLEHSRIFAFANDSEPKTFDPDAAIGPDVYIGSADLMHRNLDRRVEALVRLTDETHIQELISMLDLSVSEQTSSWHLNADSTWTRHSKANSGEPLLDIQSYFIAQQRRKRSVNR